MFRLAARSGALLTSRAEACFPADLVDARLPAASLLPERKPQRLVDLLIALRRPATAAAHQLLSRVFPYASVFPYALLSAVF
jgi:hypothetical protein